MRRPVARGGGADSAGSRGVGETGPVPSLTSSRPEGLRLPDPQLDARVSAGLLAVEELLDATNRATMNDERIHPVSRQIAKLHVMEEARHVSFAKTYLAEVWPTLDDEERAAVKALAPVAVGMVADLTVDPAVHDALGIAGGAEAARANPHHRARVVEGLAKLTRFLGELGVIDAETGPKWAELGLTR